MRHLYFTLPGGGFLSLILAVFIRYWAIDHGYLFLAGLATIYIIILLIPLIIALFTLIVIGLAFLFFIISGRRWTKKERRRDEAIDAEWKES